ncbi:MAG: helix-turn-helix domain-containing protein [Planctomycetales bacterium]|nr:helix-turn-helix domain-containing protein [Planctomycetales bacterium]
MISNRNLLTVKEVAGLLRLSVSETYKLIKAGDISHFRVGPGRGSIRIDPQAVDDFLDTRSVGNHVASRIQKQPPPPLKHLKR